MDIVNYNHSNHRFSQLKSHAIKVVVGLLVLLVTAQTATAGQRYALLIGNSEYDTLLDLRNPVNDATAVSRALIEAAFNIEVVSDPTFATARSALEQFVDQLIIESRAAKIEAVLFFFAGHALQYRAENYLLPRDFEYAIDEANGTVFDQSRAFERALEQVAFSISEVISTINQIDAETYIFIFDACRNSPVEDLVRSEGLAEVVAGPNNYIVFSASPGATALDGTNGNSPFSEALAHRIPFQGIPIEVMMQGVRRDVLDATDGFQLPWDSSSLLEPFSFVPLGAFGQREPIENITEQERELWRYVYQTNFNPTALRRYLLLFPNGQYAVEARSRLNRIE